MVFRNRTSIVDTQALAKMVARDTNFCTKCKIEFKEGDHVVKKLNSSHGSDKGHSVRNFHQACWEKMEY